jgi:hypothetical protein
MMHSRVIVARRSALASLVGRHRRILLEWTTSISMVRFFLPCHRTLLRAFVVALGIADEVDRLELKGSKKKKSKKLDEDWMVITTMDPHSYADTETEAFNSQYSSPWPSRRYRRSSKLCGRLRAARSSSNYSLE